MVFLRTSKAIFLKVPGKLKHAIEAQHSACLEPPAEGLVDGDATEKSLEV